MKVGDTVTVRDTSWAALLCEGEVKGAYRKVSRERCFRVTALNGRFPSPEALVPGDSCRTNDTLLTAIDDLGFMLFTQERFCEVASPVETPLKVSIPRGTKEVLLSLE